MSQEEDKYAEWDVEAESGEEEIANTRIWDEKGEGEKLAKAQRKKEKDEERAAKKSQKEADKAAAAEAKAAKKGSTKKPTGKKAAQQPTIHEASQRQTQFQTQQSQLQTEATTQPEDLMRQLLSAQEDDDVPIAASKTTTIPAAGGSKLGTLFSSAKATLQAEDDDDDDDELDLGAYKAIMDDDAVPTSTATATGPATAVVGGANQQAWKAAPSASMSGVLELGTGSAAVAPKKPGQQQANPGLPPSATATQVKQEGDAKPVKANYTIKPLELSTEGVVVQSDSGEATTLTAQHIAPVTHGAGGVSAASGNAPGANGMVLYWLDIKERTYRELQDAGSVTIIGKVYDPETSKYESACVRVMGMQNVAYAAPEFDAKEEDVVMGLHHLARQVGIQANLQIEEVKKWYAFEDPRCPQGCNSWFKVTYPATEPPFVVHDEETVLPERFPAIKAVLGGGTSMVERFLLDHKMKGPDYLSISDVHRVVDERDKLSHCKHEFICNSPGNVSILVQATETPPPPLTAVSIHLDTQLDATERHKEIFAFSFVVHDHIHQEQATMAISSNTVPHDKRFVAVRPWGPGQHIDVAGLGLKCKNANLQGVVRPYQDETKLIDALLHLLKVHDPDLIVGHNFYGYTLDVLLHRIKKLKGSQQMQANSLNLNAAVPHWSIIGRLKNRMLPQLQSGVGGEQEATFQEKQLCCGRLVVDSYQTAKEHYKTNNYKVLELARGLKIHGVLGAIKPGEADRPHTKWSQELMTQASQLDTLLLSLIRSLNMATLALGIVLRLDIIPLTRRLTVLAGNLWTRTLNGARSERIEYLLLHKFHGQDYVCPDKSSNFGGGGKFGKGKMIGGRTVGKKITRDEENAVIQEQEDATEAQAEQQAQPQHPGLGGDVIGDDEVPAGEEPGAGNAEGVTMIPGGGPAPGMAGADLSGGLGIAGTGGAVGGKAKYKGGKVLEPIKGLYSDFVLLLDFNSLYPSIIQEFNICFTTVDRQGKTSVADGITLPGLDTLVCSKCNEVTEADGRTPFFGSSKPCPHRIILPRTIRELVMARRAVKKRMTPQCRDADPGLYGQLDIKQKALKLTANSMYGCLGFEHSRFYAQSLAELVTMQGREALTNAAELVPACSKELNLRVIYGDTDSVMVQTGIHDDIAKARAVATDIKKEVNKKYTNLEIDIDGIFKSILLVRKKKYAALTVVDFMGEGKEIKEEVKGLDMVRRDWCPLSQATCRALLNKILSQDAAGDQEELIQFISQTMGRVANECRIGEITLEQYAVSKELTRAPEDYDKGYTLPHVAVALRLNAKKENPVKAKDFIPYVIVKDPVEDYLTTWGHHQNAKNSLAARAMHRDEVDPSKGHQIDVDYYLANQLLPPVLRLCEHINGFNVRHVEDTMEIKRSGAGGLGGGDGGAAGAGSSRASSMASVMGSAAAYPAAFNVDELGELEKTYPGVYVLQATCPECHYVSKVDPHARVKAMLDAYKMGKPWAGPKGLEMDPQAKQGADRLLQVSKKAEEPDYNAGNEAAQMGGFGSTYNDDDGIESPRGDRRVVSAAHIAMQKRDSHMRKWLYSCEQCNSAFSIGFVANILTGEIRQSMKRFYEESHSNLTSNACEVAHKRVRNQLSYYRAIFDIPQFPGVSEEIISAHKQVLRCLNGKDQMVSLKDIEDWKTNHELQVMRRPNQGRRSGRGEEDDAPPGAFPGGAPSTSTRLNFKGEEKDENEEDDEEDGLPSEQRLKDPSGNAPLKIAEQAYNQLDSHYFSLGHVL